MHVDHIVKKANPRLYALRQLKRCGVSTEDVVRVYCFPIRPILKYACPVFAALPQYIADVNPVFKKDDETEIGNYRPLSLLSVPSKILETIVADSIIHHAFIENKLITDKQWAYRRGYSTELLLVHMTEIWRSAIDSNKVVGIVLVDFQKAFDCVSHNVLLRKLENDFGINGVLLDWLRSYLDNRKQYTVLNGIASDLNTVKSGIPQGSVLGPTLFSLYTSDKFT